MRALLDTNVLIDIFTGRPPEGNAASKLLVMQALGDIELWVSAKSFTDVFYAMRKNNKSAVIQQTFLESFDFLKVCSIEAGDIREASQRCWDDFEDCLVEVCAEKVKAKYLLTRDKTRFSQSRREVMSPKDFFDRLEEEMGLVYEEITW